MMMHEAIRGQAGSIAVLDIGSTKVVCIIAKRDEDGEIQVVGIGHQLAKGMKAGAITDVGEVEMSIVAAVHSAEQMCGETIDNVVVNVSGAHLVSRSVSVELDVTGDGVSDYDIIDLINEGCMSLESDDHSIIHTFPVQYYLDKTKGLSDPRGMVGEVLGSELHIVMAQNTFLKNLVNCVARCHLNIDDYVLSSHASALSCLAEDEMELGVTLIDMGGGVTSFSVFAEGKNIYSSSIPVGGKHVTSDIARGLSTTLVQAERLKTLHGSAISSVKDAEVMIEVPQLGEDLGEDENNTMPRSMLVGVVRPRMEEIFELIRSRIEAAGVEKIAGRRCVITGGASQMLGVSDLAARVLAKQVRKGKPHDVNGLADMATGPAFSTAVGMIDFLSQRPWEDSLLHGSHARRGMGYTAHKIIDWFKENF
ncbi:MAG: cell division protein FtsA [Rickettsiales bacterium]|nr:cell division protein FtsA [Rickettsiales bacterium]